MPSYRLSRRADADLDEIIAFTVERWGTEQANVYLSGLQALFHLASSRPMMGRSAAKVLPKMRRVEHMSHVILYTLLPDGIQIERVLHKSRALKKKDFRA